MDLLGRSKLLKEYQMGKTIGQGAFSKVKLGYHRETGQKVAIKIVDKKVMAEKAKKSKAAHEERERKNKAKHPETATKQNTNTKEDESSSALNTQYPGHEEGVPEDCNLPLAENVDFVSKLQLEVQLMLRLEHPNIVTVYQVIDSETECFIIMEYASGGELIEYIASRGNLSEKEARKFFRQIISAIDHCHLANVVHRDLKLENLLLNREKNILLSDFGLGRTFRDDLEEYMKTFCGTPNYAAVELISGIPYVGVKSDIWAMGVVLYLMVTGKPPFQGETISLLYKEIKAVNYKVYDTFSKELRHLLSRMLCKNPAQRIDMNELRLHPWVNFEEHEYPVRITPRISGNIESATLGQFILGIDYDKGATTYKFHEHKKPEKGFSFRSSKAAIHKRANTVCQDTNITLNTKNPTNDDPEPAKPLKREQSTEKKSTFSFFRRISVTIPDSSKYHENESVISESSEASGNPNAKPSPLMQGAIESQKLSTPPNTKLQPESAPPRRHSFFGSTLTPQSPNLRARRASDAAIDLEFLKSASETPQKSQNQGFFSNLSAMLKKSASSIVTSPATNHHSDSPPRDSSPKPTVSPAPIEGPSKAFRPSGPANRLIRSSTYNTPSPEIQTPPGEQSNNYNTGSSPIAPSINSVRQLRLASHSPLVPRRESFGAKVLAQNDTESRSHRKHDNKLLVPGEELKEISKSYNAFLSRSDHPDENGNELMKSAILASIGHQVKDSAEKLGSHDALSLTSRYTFEREDSTPNPTSYADVEKDVEYWKELHFPAKVIRSMRFSFNSSTLSNMEPADIFSQLIITLNKLNEQRKTNLTFNRTDRDLYLLRCKFKKPFSSIDETVIFEVEVCKVWLLKIHGVRIKRIAGSPLLFKELYSFLETELRIS